MIFRSFRVFRSLKKKTPSYPVHWDREKLATTTAKIVTGTLRVPAFATNKADVISSTDKTKYPISSFYDRNRAMNGDIVACELEPESNAKVISVIERNTVTALVSIKPDSTTLQPRDTRLPAWLLETPKTAEELDSLSQNPSNSPINEETEFLGVSKFKEWPPTQIKGPTTELLKVLGRKNDYSGAELDALLEFYGLNSTPYPSSIDASSFSDKIPVNLKSENRIDLTDSYQIFTIDPVNAKDLDDAISIKVVHENHYELGIHVADPSHYVDKDSPLDIQARINATTIYFPNKTYPMLPTILSNELCSLVPGSKKRAFSLFVDVEKQGNQLETFPPRFSKTLISSAARLNYDEVDTFLLYSDGASPNSQSIPALVQSDLKLLSQITQNRRNRRLQDEGFVTFDRSPPSTFTFDPVSQLPVDIVQSSHSTSSSSSHNLIEELMVLANKVVAEKLATKLTGGVFRRHEKSEYTSCIKLILANINRPDIIIPDDIPLNKCNNLLKKELSPVIFESVSSQILVELNRAEYLSKGDATATNTTSDSDVSHFALGLEKYMHFTSPIRRYPDIIAHRILYSIIVDDLPSSKKDVYETEELRGLLENCNLKHKKADEVYIDSLNMNLGVLVKQKPEGINTDCVLIKLIKQKEDTELSSKAAVEFYIPLIQSSRSLSFERLLGFKSEKKISKIEFDEDGKSVQLETEGEGVLNWKIGDVVKLDLVSTGNGIQWTLSYSK
jgi:VacB/RNase II family 3'-5' exoribonuclease